MDDKPLQERVGWPSMQFLKKHREVLDSIDKKKIDLSAWERVGSGIRLICCARATKNQFVHLNSWKSGVRLVEYTQLPKWRLAQGHERQSRLSDSGPS